MSKLQQPFDARQVDPSQGSPPFPVGRHKVVIIACEPKENKSKDGGFEELVMKIIEGPNAGFEGVGDRLNLWNNSEKAVEIAYRRLSAYCHVTGKYRIEATEELVNIPFYGEWQVQNTDEGKAKGYTQLYKLFDVNGNEPGKAGQNQQPSSGAGQWSGNSQNPNAGAAGNANAGNPAWGGGQPTNAPQGGNGGGNWGGNANANATQGNAGGNAAPGNWGGGNANAGNAGGSQQKAPWQK